MTKTLFIGGVADGQWIATNGQRVYHVSRPVPIGILDEYPPSCVNREERMFPVDRYKLCGFGPHVAYCLDAPDFDPMAQLLLNYRPGVALDLRKYDVTEESRSEFNDYLCRGGRAHKARVLLDPIPARP